MDLIIWDCADLESILPHENVWPICPSLRSLSIRDCHKLSTLPDALHNLQCLEKFQVNLTMQIREPIEHPTPLAVSTSGTNKGATVEPFLSESSKLVELPDSVTKPSLEKPELLSAQGTEPMEKKWKMSVPETEIDTVPSQPTEGRVNFQLIKHVGKPIEPLGE